MKNIKLTLGLLTSAAAAFTLQAQVELTLTGSTAFRSIVIDRSAYLFDNYTAVTNDTSSPNYITFRGTMSGKVPSLGVTPVIMRLSFSGSGSGMLAVKSSSPVSTADTLGTYVNKVPDLGFSDVFPGSATPAIAESSFNRSVLGVIPFVFVRNNAMSGVTGINREQAVLLMTATGTYPDGLGGYINGMPVSYLGGSGSNPIFLTGRDSGSGTRITVHKVIGFNGTPILWTTNGAGQYIQTGGLTSGGLERNVIAAKADAIGYLGLADAASIGAFASAITFDGVPYSEPAVANGAYTLWGYEHVVNRVGGLSSNQQAVKNALVSAITDPTYQNLPIYANSFVRLNQMNVERGTDGGPITSLNF